MNAGQRLRIILREIDLKPTELAAEVGVTYENIRYYYTQKRFSSVILSRLTPALEKRGVNMDYFKDENEPPRMEDVRPTIEKVHGELVEMHATMKEILEELKKERATQQIEQP
jgi:hypothetical protein